MRLRARNRIVTGALVLLVLLVVLGALLGAAPPARAAEAFSLPGRPAPLGMATDQERDRYWLLERASGSLQLVAVGSDGTVQGRMSSRDSLSSAQAIAFADGLAWVADIGGRRAQVAVHTITEPWPGTEILAAPRQQYSYPDGRHDAAAILVDADHRVHIVTTGDDAGIYRAPESGPSADPLPLERIADAPAGVTDAVVLRDGRWVLRTATRLITLDPSTHAVLGEAEIGVEERGQAVTEQVGGEGVVTALGADGAVTPATVPGPPPTASPTPRPSHDRVVPPTTPDGLDPTRTFRQTGTTAALVGALALALLAAAVVLFRR